MQKPVRTFSSLVGILILLNIILLAAVSYLLLSGWPNISDIHRIDIKDPSGRNRIVLSNEEKIPDPIIGGKVFQRAYKPAGLIFYDRKGNERGGLAITDNEQTNLNALAFDYQNADAVGILAQDNKNDDYFRAGMIINDKDPAARPGHNINRINLITENGNASLVIKDRKEIPRIILKVDSLGNPSIEMFDADGKAIR